MELALGRDVDAHARCLERKIHELLTLGAGCPDPERGVVAWPWAAPWGLVWIVWDPSQSTITTWAGLTVDNEVDLANRQIIPETPQ